MVDIHKIAKGGPFFYSLLEIKRFLGENPKEFVVVEIKEQLKNPLSDLQRNFLKEMFVYMFKDKLITKKDVKKWFSLKKVKMEEIWENKKQILGLFSSTFHRDEFVSCRKMTKTAQKAVNYQIPRIRNQDMGIMMLDDFIMDISIKTTSKIDFFKANLSQVDSQSIKSKLIQNQFILKGKIEKKEFLASLKNFLKSTIKGITEICHDLLKKDEIIDLLLRFCQSEKLNIGKPVSL
jgi:hypothetical protein